MTVTCPYCGQQAALVTGEKIYPHRSDLTDKSFWLCEPCNAYVGCHAKDCGYGDGTRPLGRLANAKLRFMKSKTHAAFDPLWRNGSMKRHIAYAWLAREMGIAVENCHIGMFDVEQCQIACDIIARKKTNVQRT